MLLHYCIINLKIFSVYSFEERCSKRKAHGSGYLKAINKSRIMKQRIIVWLLAPLALLWSCASPVYVEQSPTANLGQYKTYAWVEVKATQTDNRNVTGLAGDAIHRTARAELEAKGLREVTENPDALLSYDVLVERTTERRSEPVYTQPFSRVFYNPFFRRWGTVYYPSRFVGYDTYTVPVREGTLTLTLTDARTDSTVWQGWTTETMRNRRFSSSDVEKAVRHILKKLPAGS